MYPTILEEVQVLEDQEMEVLTMVLAEREREKKAKVVEKEKVEIWKLQAKRTAFGVQNIPQMLLSGRDPDPSRDATSETKVLTDRHPPLYQGDIDRTFNVWWLNTTHPYAANALKKAGGPKGLAFKSHHLSMFRDMVQREALRILQRREAELPLDMIENELDEISNKFLAELPIDLIESLLE